MGLLKTIRISHKRHIEDELRRQILRGTYPPGSRIPPVKELAERFGICVATVQKALDRLESQAFIVRRHGSGTFVRERPRELTMADAVALCMITGGHVHSELYRLLNIGLQNAGRIVFSLDINDEDVVRRLRQLYVSGVPAFIVFGSPYRRQIYPAIEEFVDAGRKVIGILDWRVDALQGRISKILVDHEEGGRDAAGHLFRRGHRRALLLGSSTMIADLRPETPARLRNQGFGFVQEWERLGGSWSSLESYSPEGEPYPTPLLDAEKLRAEFAAEPHPTAVFGIRDVEAWVCQNIISEQIPGLRGKIEIFGYGGTPWSLAGHPPFSTMDFDLEAVAEAVCSTLETKSSEAGALPVTKMIKPRLVLR